MKWFKQRILKGVSRLSPVKFTFWNLTSMRRFSVTSCPGLEFSTELNSENTKSILTGAVNIQHEGTLAAWAPCLASRLTTAQITSLIS